VSQVHCETDVAAADVLELAGQLEQEYAPTSCLKVLAKHSSHRPPFGPENPMLQRHEEVESCPVAPFVPEFESTVDKHVLHTALPFASL
jgi:hypothetical protein